MVSYVSGKVSMIAPHRYIVDRILEKCPLALQESDGTHDDMGSVAFDLKGVVSLNARVKRAAFLKDRELAKLISHQQHAFRCQDIINSYNSSEMYLYV
jgi:hypothetical protein